MSESSILVKGVSVAYGGRRVVANINLDVRHGEVFGLMGLNGSGKTTMIKTVLGLRSQDSGEIYVLGADRLSSKSKSRLSYLPEKFEPPWFLSGMEFLRFSLQLYNKEFDRNKVLEMACRLALDTKALDRRVNTYSKGMRQKLGLMGTMLTGCSLFILDEPMSGLDPMARFNVKKMLVDMKNGERTIFLSSHVLADMDEICDRVALLHNGKICYTGTPCELKRQTDSDSLEQAFLEMIEINQTA